MAKKSFLTRSAGQRIKVQAKYSKRMDRWINKKMKQLGKLWRKKVAGLLSKLLLFAAAVAGGFMAGKAAVEKAVSGEREEIK